MRSKWVEECTSFFFCVLTLRVVERVWGVCSRATKKKTRPPTNYKHIILFHRVDRMSHDDDDSAKRRAALSAYHDESLTRLLVYQTGEERHRAYAELVRRIGDMDLALARTRSTCQATLDTHHAALQTQDMDLVHALFFLCVAASIDAQCQLMRECTSPERMLAFLVWLRAYVLDDVFPRAVDRPAPTCATVAHTIRKRWLIAE
jgi:hypothetical protein